MEVKFEEIDKYEHSTDFLKKDKIAEIPHFAHPY